jgi:hypothetical protein
MYKRGTGVSVESRKFKHTFTSLSLMWGFKASLLPGWLSTPSTTRKISTQYSLVGCGNSGVSKFELASKSSAAVAQRSNGCAAKPHTVQSRFRSMNSKVEG